VVSVGSGNGLASRGIEERFLDYADRLLRKSEGGRKSRSATLGMTCFAAVEKELCEGCSFSDGFCERLTFCLANFFISGTFLLKRGFGY
jgi:hypothetical protein